MVLSRLDPSHTRRAWLMATLLGVVSQLGGSTRDAFATPVATPPMTATRQPGELKEFSPTGSPTGEIASAPRQLALTFLARDCGEPSELITRVTRRSSRIAFVEETTPGATQVRAVIIAGEGGRTTAILSITNLEGDTAARQVEVSSCEEALDALALIVVLSFDPSALDGTPRSSPVSSPTAPKREESNTPSASTDLRERGPTAPRVGVSAFVSTLHGPAPNTLLGPTLGLTLLLTEARWPLPPVTLFAAHLRAREQTELGLAHFALSTLGIAIVPLSLTAGPIHFGPHVGVTAGVMRASGEHTTAPRSSTRAWAATGLGASLALELAPQLALTSFGEVSFPWVRDTYQFAPQPFHEASAVNLGLGAGLALAFP